MKGMTVKGLIKKLETCDPDSIVRLAIQPSWPFEHSIDRVEEFFMDDGADIVYLSEGGQVRYLPGEAKDGLGWH